MVRKYRCRQKRSDRVEERVYNGTSLDLTLDYTVDYSIREDFSAVDFRVNKERERNKFKANFPFPFGLDGAYPRRSNPRYKGKSFDKSLHFR
jgi:hypothetical protein